MTEPQPNARYEGYVGMNAPYVRCDCDRFTPEIKGEDLCDCGHTGSEQHANETDECLAQDGDGPDDELHPYVLWCLEQQEQEQQERQKQEDRP